MQVCLLTLNNEKRARPLKGLARIVIKRSYSSLLEEVFDLGHPGFSPGAVLA